MAQKLESFSEASDHRHLFTLDFSSHAMARVNQRSRHSDVSRVSQYADEAMPAGPRGRYAAFISKKRLANLLKSGLLSAQEAERLTNLFVVFADDDTVVTVIKNKAFSPYRHGPRGSWSYHV